MQEKAIQDQDSFRTCLEKQEKMKQIFKSCATQEAKYEKIIELGKKQKPIDPLLKTECNLVPGCQSIMYMNTTCKDGLLYFESESDAIISSGLAVLLIEVYNGETPETVLKCPPKYLEEIGIPASLTPGRANGLASLYVRMKKDALRFLVLLHSKE